MKNMLEYNGIKLKWLNHHASFLIEAPGPKTILIDPWELKETPKADIILVTHMHFDHFSSDDINRARTSGTLVIAPYEAKKDISGNFKVAEPGMKVAENGIIIEAIPAYNTTKFKSPGEPFHPKSSRWVGYIINISGTLIYHAGDTDAIPEMQSLLGIDIALVPVGGTYTMTAIEAANACNSFKPKIAVPMHWGKIVGEKSSAEEFAVKFKGETRILEI
jgi:L-ascorbate metabolism protein UlaG (beta-lactamase superfamily)